MGLGLGRGVRREPESLAGRVGLIDGHPAIVGGQELGLPGARDPAESGKEILAGHPGPLGHGHELGQQPGLREHLLTDFSFHRRRHRFGERRCLGQHLRHPMRAGTGLLEDGPPGGKGLQRRRHPNGGQDEQKGRDGDSGPQRHARVLPEPVHRSYGGGKAPLKPSPLSPPMPPAADE